MTRTRGPSAVVFPLQVTADQGEGVRLPSILKGLLDVSCQGFQGRSFSMVVFLQMLRCKCGGGITQSNKTVRMLINKRSNITSITWL